MLYNRTVIYIHQKNMAVDVTKGKRMDINKYYTF